MPLIFLNLLVLCRHCWSTPLYKLGSFNTMKLLITSLEIFKAILAYSLNSQTWIHFQFTLKTRLVQLVCMLRWSLEPFLCCTQDLLSPLRATHSMACVWVASEKMHGTQKNLTGFSYLSESFVKCGFLWNELAPPPDRSLSARPLIDGSEEFGIFLPGQTPSLLACVSTTLRTGMKADVSLKLLLLTMWVWMLRPSV